jgi:hypothetical protein
MDFCLIRLLHGYQRNAIAIATFYRNEGACPLSPPYQNFGAKEPREDRTCFLPPVIAIGFPRSFRSSPCFTIKEQGVTPSSYLCIITKRLSVPERIDQHIDCESGRSLQDINCIIIAVDPDPVPSLDFGRCFASAGNARQTIVSGYNHGVR